MAAGRRWVVNASPLLLLRKIDRLTLGDGLAVDLQPGFACGEHNREGAGIVHLRPVNVSQERRKGNPFFAQRRRGAKNC